MAILYQIYSILEILQSKGKRIQLCYFAMLTGIGWKNNNFFKGWQKTTGHIGVKMEGGSMGGNTLQLEYSRQMEEPAIYFVI